MSEPNPTPPAGRSRLRAALPHIATAIVAIATSLLVQRASVPQPPAVARPATAVPSATPQAADAATPAPSPLPATPAPATPTAQVLAGVSRQDLIDLRAENEQIWVALYLSRAISQIADAEVALRVNDLRSVDQVLIAVDDSIALASEHAAPNRRDPVMQLRRDLSGMREDLYLRPEGMDARLTRLRQTILVLIDVGQ